jgi:hypothetical protein
MLFDKHDKPVIAGHDEEADWTHCEGWEEYVYENAESFSKGQWACMIQSVRDLYADYYRKWS